MRRPPKPRIKRPRLVWKWDRHKELWQPYHRVTWREDGRVKQKTVLLDWRGDAKELDRLYWLAQSGQHKAQRVPEAHTWGECITAWRSDKRVQKKLADSTKRQYRTMMDRILVKNERRSMKNATRSDVRAAHDKLSDTPRSADRYLQVFSLLWNYAKKELDWPLHDNPASGVRKFGRRSEYQPWPDWMVAKLESAPLVVEIACKLILFTGQRPSAAIDMKRSQFNGEWMTVIDQKGQQELEVFCPAPLRSFIEGLPRNGRYLIAKNLNEPLGYDAVEKQFRKWRSDLGKNATDYPMHGLRKLAIIRLAEAGASDAEIQAVTGQSAETVAYYRRKASRKRLSKNAQSRLK